MSREAMKQALEALETNNKAWKHLADSDDAGFWEAEEQPFYELSVKAIATLRQELETEQEPVAHIDHRIHGWPDCFVIRADPPHTSPLYLSLPKREWVGLTDEEVSYFEYQATFCDELDTALMAELIEQALKKKNNGRYRNRTTTERTKLKEKNHG